MADPPEMDLEALRVVLLGAVGTGDLAGLRLLAPLTLQDAVGGQNDICLLHGLNLGCPLGSMINHHLRCDQI